VGTDVSEKRAASIFRPVYHNLFSLLSNLAVYLDDQLAGSAHSMMTGVQLPTAASILCLRLQISSGIEPVSYPMGSGWQSSRSVNFNHSFPYCRARSVVTRLRTVKQKNGGSIPDRVKRILVSKRPDRLWAHPAIYSIGNGDSLPGGKAGEV
jgi:hypothetical protein